MGLAGFDVGAAGHSEGEGGHGGVFEDFFQVDGLGGGEAAAVDVHVQEVGAEDYYEKTQHERGEKRGPDAEFPSDQYENAEGDFGEGESVGDELNSPVGEEFEGFDLQGEIGEVGGDGELQEEPRPESVVGEKGFGVAGVDEDGAEDEAAGPDYGAAEVEWAGLQHGYF